MDFITKLPKSKDPLTGTEYDSIFVIVDWLSGYSYFKLYLEASNLEAIVYTLIRIVFLRYSTLEEIILDRGSLFTSKF